VQVTLSALPSNIHAGYGVELYLTNVTVADGNGEKHIGSDICIYAKNESNYLMTIRDTYFNHSRGCAIFIYDYKEDTYSRQYM